MPIGEHRATTKGKKAQKQMNNDPKIRGIHCSPAYFIYHLTVSFYPAFIKPIANF